MTIRKRSFPYKPYRAQVVLVFHPDKEVEELFRYAQRLDRDLAEHKAYEDWSGIIALVLDATASRKVYVLWGGKAQVSDLAHECVHVVSRMFDGIDASLSRATEENFAYTVTSVFEDLYHYILKYSGPNRAHFLMTDNQNS